MEFSQIAVLIEPEHEVEAVRRMKRKMLQSSESLVDWEYYDSRVQPDVMLRRPLRIRKQQMNDGTS